MKKIAVLNDIHGNYYLLNKILKELENEKLDDYIVCGDVITDGFDNNEVLDTLKNKTENIILGNREISIINYDDISWKGFNQWKSMLYAYNNLSKENLSFISTLPKYKIIVTENKKICISHGSPYDARECVSNNSFELFDKVIKDFDCDIYLFAHTHKTFNTNYKGRLFINAGAVNNPVEGRPISTYGIIIIDDKKIEYIQKEYIYEFDEVKNYYVDSKYHDNCLEWCNLIIYTLKFGFDYGCDFIEYLSRYNENSETITSNIWEDKFKEYMKKEKLDIL